MAILPEKATHRQTRTFNQQLVLRTIYDHAEISRAEVARLTGLTRTSVSDLVSELLRERLVEETGRGPSTGGKAPILLQVRANGRHVIGLDLGESAFSGAVVDLRGNVVRSFTLPIGGRNGGEALEAVHELIECLVNGNGSAQLLGIGIGTPGLIDSRTGTVHWAVNLDWADLPLGHIVEERFNVPAVVANDSQAAAVAEVVFGTAPRPANLIVLRVGRGVGAGLILNGQLFQGDGSGAGEIGHTVFDPDGEQCRCGRRGCLETVASMRAMVTAAHSARPTIDDERSLTDTFRGGDDAIVCDIVLRGARALGLAIGGLIGTLNVDRVLLVGPATELGQEWLAAVRDQAAASALARLARDTTIEFGAARENDVVVGASALLMTRALGLSLAR